MSLFPVTLPSVVRDLASADVARRQHCLEVIADIYWKPLYVYLRMRHGMTPELAEDTTQAFFTRVIDGSALVGHDRERGRFRSFLRHAMDNHVIDQHRRRTAMRRGGPLPHVDLADVERELAAGGSLEDAFDRVWIERVVARAVVETLAALERRGKPVHAELFRRFHLHDDPPRYDAVARELGITVTDVTNWLHVARREFRRAALGLLRELTANQEEFVDEARAAFGIDVTDDSAS